MRYLSVCSGIEAATCAWHPLGWTPVAFSEVDKFPSAVLAHHYPDVPNWGDMTKFKEWPDADVDVLVGGTPCQSFSVAGLRKGMDDPRGNLALTYLAIAQRYRPQWLVWENVPGVLSSNGGRDFGSILGGMVELGYGVAYRVLDAQHFGVPQRRRRVFVVGYLGDWRRAAAVLFERESLCGHPAPRREAGKGITPVLAAGAHGSNGAGIGRPGDPAFTLDTTRPGRGGGQAVMAPVHVVNGNSTPEVSEGLAFPLRADDGSGNRQAIVAHAFKASHFTRGKDGAPSDLVPPLSADADKGDQDTLVLAHTLSTQCGIATEDGTGRGSPLVPVGLEDIADPVLANVGRTYTQEGSGNFKVTNVVLAPAIAFSVKDHGADAGDISPTLRGGGHHRSHANGGVMPAVAFEWQPGSTQRLDMHENFSPALIKSQTPAVAFAQNQCGEVRAGDVFNTLNTNSIASGRNTPLLQAASAVRRLTPRECERLQGFPDDFTLVPYRGKPASDGPRYKALGNSMAVPCMRWIGERIAMVEAIPCESEAA